MNKEMINEDLKEMLSYKETLSLLCYNINYARRFERVTAEELARLLSLDTSKLEKASRLMAHIGMAKMYYDRDKVYIEMIDVQDPVVKNTVFDVLWDRHDEYSRIYANMMKGVKI